MNKGLDVLTNHIEQWAKDRNLHTADPTKQMLKLMEEVGELAQGLAKNRKKAAIKDAIGDAYVVLTILSMQLDIDIEECIEMAYGEIADRKGKMVDGVFVKESDLEGN
jgi:NTP pyrophosphatase (non-canonical NTP hydrolase)